MGCQKSTLGLAWWTLMAMVTVVQGAQVSQRNLADPVLWSWEELKVEPSWEELEVEPPWEELEVKPLWEELEVEPLWEELEVEPPLEELEPRMEEVNVEPPMEELEVKPLEKVMVEVARDQQQSEEPLGKKRKPSIRPWPDATIPYVIQGSDTAKSKVEAVFRMIEEDTCLKFTVRTGEERYLLVKEGKGGCWSSYTGYPGSNRKVTVGLGNGCLWPGILLHELLHALGYPHEHSRPDRDHHITVKWKNIKRGKERQFRINQGFPTLAVPYDYHSVMHYSRRAFSKNGQPTLQPKTVVQDGLGNKRLSQLDKLKLNSFYTCS